MITVKKDAIKYKSSDGTMKDSGVLCQVGVVGEGVWEYSTGAQFKQVVFPDNYDFVAKINPLKKDATTVIFMQSTGVRSIKLIANDKVGYLNNANMFYQTKDTSLEIIDLSDFITTFKGATNTFLGCLKLKKILGYLDFSECTQFSGTFADCSSLIEVRVVKETIKANISFSKSSNLSDDSIQSIINGLALVETAQTLTLHPDVKAKLTEEQISQITSKNWTLAQEVNA